MFGFVSIGIGRWLGGRLGSSLGRSRGGCASPQLVCGGGRRRWGGTVGGNNTPTRQDADE